MTQRIAMITDSTCDIPQDLREKYDIHVIPLTIVFGEEQLLDGVDISARGFYERLITDQAVHPSTSQPSPGFVRKIYEKVRKTGAEEIVCILISSRMSGTLTSAEQAAKDFPIPVHIHDSRNNSMGLGFQVLAAARVREAGGGVKEMLTAAETVRDRMIYHILLDTITYLKRGGRIGDAVALLDSVLSVKPVVTVKADTGTVGMGMPARSHRIGKKHLVKNFFKKLDTTKPMHITVLHNNIPEEAREMAEKIREMYDPAELFVQIVSPILGVHTGPNAIALCGYSE